MLRTLNKTNNNLAAITDNMKGITSKINSPNSLWSLLMDTVIADNVKQAIVSIRITGSRSAEITGNMDDIIKGIKAGKGSVGALLTDTVVSGKMNQAIVSIKLAGDRAATVTGDLSKIVAHVDSGKGLVGRLIMDTTFIPNLNKSMVNIRTGSQGLNEVIEGLKHSFPLKSYFKKQEKEKLKKQQDSLKANK
jgi:phospholipid/cholesterol/gamma-HCH transport system substrate-binding protein